MRGQHGVAPTAGLLTLGIELEYSDIVTREAARYVQELHGENLEHWTDRSGQYSKPRLSYDRWNVMSDGSLLSGSVQPVVLGEGSLAASLTCQYGSVLDKRWAEVSTPSTSPRDAADFPRTPPRESRPWCLRPQDRFGGSFARMASPRLKHRSSAVSRDSVGRRTHKSAAL